jgi:hypothetical protein
MINTQTMQVSVSVATLSAIFGAWFYVDSYFAKASDLQLVSNTLEQSQYQLRIDVLEDRIDRELRSSRPDNRRVGKMRSQIRRLETRLEVLIKRGK